MRVLTLDHDARGAPLTEGEIDGVPNVRGPRVGPRRYPLARRLRADVDGATLVHAHGLDGHSDGLAWPRARAPCT